ncbi:MAG: DNA topoisomerase VI subunit B [Cryobacterium sp.]|nr:DNA topoisomerase VI subunit B [Oligoflexia bacterium]
MAKSNAVKTAAAKEPAAPRASKANLKISTSSTAEYFSKNLQQVGFSSQVKAVLTTLKEAVDNSLDACEEHGILPEIEIWVEKMGAGSLKNSDKIRVRVSDNGPGIDPEDVPKVFGEYLASSKFGRGRCSRGQQGIGISAATTWAQLTNASGARVTTKTKAMRKAFSALVEVDIKNNKGVLKEKETLDWDRSNGTNVEFIIDGRIQLNGEAGILNYLTGTVLVNPHLTLHHNLPCGASEDGGGRALERISIPRVTDTMPEIPEATEPHLHTMKLGEFIAHSHLYGRVKVDAWLKRGFSRVNEGTIKDLIATGLKRNFFDKNVDQLNEVEFKDLYTKIQNTTLIAPSTKSVLMIGEEALAKSIQRVGKVDFFSVVSRKPTICDFKPVEVEIAIARLLDRAGENDAPIQVLRFANRVPLQFDKAACAVTQAIQTVNWRAYGLGQPKESLPLGPYIMAVSIVSPFIKFKNASKETIDASDELVEEIRRTLIQAGQRLSKYIKKELRANDLEEKLRYIEQFGPILVDGLCRITNASDDRKKKAQDGLMKILGRDADAAETALAEAEKKLGHGSETVENASEIESRDGEDVDPISVDEIEADSKSKSKSKKKLSAKSAPAPKKLPVAKKLADVKKPKIIVSKGK